MARAPVNPAECHQPRHWSIASLLQIHNYLNHAPRPRDMEESRCCSSKGLLLIIAAPATDYQTLLTVSYRSVTPRLRLNQFLPPTAGRRGACSFLSRPHGANENTTWSLGPFGVDNFITIRVGEQGSGPPTVETAFCFVGFDFIPMTV